MAKKSMAEAAQEAAARSREMNKKYPPPTPKPAPKPAAKAPEEKKKASVAPKPGFLQRMFGK